MVSWNYLHFIILDLYLRYTGKVYKVYKDKEESVTHYMLLREKLTVDLELM